MGHPNFAPATSTVEILETQQTPMSSYVSKSK